MIYFAKIRREAASWMQPMRDTHKKRAVLAFSILFLSGSLLHAGYKARPWSIRPSETYPARLTSEGVTIAVEPLYADQLAAKVFDKNDMVTRGIMPLAVAIFNENDFPVMVEGTTAELIQGEDRIRSFEPDIVVNRLFSKDKKSVWIPSPVPRIGTVDKSMEEAFQDFEHKFLGSKIVAAGEKGGGFLYLRLPMSQDVPGYLEKARIYIPRIYRQDTGAPMIFFEIDLQPALRQTP